MADQTPTTNPSQRFPKGKPTGSVRLPVPLPEGVVFEDCYATALVGGCLEPIIDDGVRIVAARGAHPKNGDFALFWFKGGERPALKRIVMVPPVEWMNIKGDVSAIVVAEQFNPPRTYAVDVDRITQLHRVIGIAPAGSDMVVPIDEFIADTDVA